MTKAEQGPPRGLSRRDFLRLGWTQGLARSTKEPGRAAGQRGEKPKATRLGPLEELRSLPFGSVHTRRNEGGARLYLVRLPEGLLVLSSLCPQDGHRVAWRPQDLSEDRLAPFGRFYCAADASVFDRRGLTVAGPSPRPLDAVPVRLRGGDLWADAAEAAPRDVEDLDAAIYRLDPPAAH